MRLRQRKYPTHLLAIGALLATLSCTDRPSPTNPRSAPTGAALKTISDGAHGGNDDVFFLPPMVSNPAGQPGYGDAFAPGLPVQIKIRDVTTNSIVSGAPTPVTVAATDQFYQANWDTQNPALDPTHVYRVETWIGSKRLAFADVDVVSNGSGLKNVTTGDFIGLVDGRTLPIKVRIEQGWNCVNNARCVSQVVPATIPTPVTVKTNDGTDWIIFHGDANGNWNNQGVSAVVTVEDVSAQLGNTPAGCAQGITNQVVSGHCMQITTEPAITLSTSAIVCMTLASYLTSWEMLKYDATPPSRKILSDPPPGVCPQTIPTIGSASPSSNPLVRVASWLGNSVRQLVTPKLAYAFDLGVGGLMDPGDGFSFFAPGLPAVMQIGAGNNQTALAGGVLPIPPSVQLINTHHSSPIGGATVTCSITSGGGTFAPTVTAGPATEAPTGTYTCPAWTLGATAGANTLKVTANILDAYATGGSATFTETGTVPTIGMIPSGTWRATVVNGTDVSLSPTVPITLVSPSP